MTPILRAIAAILNWLPERAARAIGGFAGTFAYAMGARRAVTMRNLSLAFPDRAERERRSIARATYKHLGEGIVEFLRSDRLSDSELFARVRADGWDLYERMKARGKGVIVATAHVGNFELLIDYCLRRGVKLTAITRRLPGVVTSFWLSRRAATGLRELPTRGSTSDLLRELRSGGTLAIIIDQNMRPKRAVFAPFFGMLAATTPAPAVLAARTGAPVILAVMVREPDGSHRLIVRGPFEISRGESSAAFMARLNGLLEKYIREYPDQWFWVHRRWKTRPPEEAVA
jgi:Kdo2-lipid IVA lauroyltransferase/acyltransferase